MAEQKKEKEAVRLEPVKEFRLLPGKEHFHGWFPVEPGDVIYLNADQASAFGDKFEAVDSKAPFKAYGPDVHQKFFSLAKSRELGSVPEVETPPQASA